MWSFIKMIFWGCLWLWIWIVTYPFLKKNKKGNCLTWAVDKFDDNDGYLAIRWSRSARARWFAWPHFLWLDGKHGHLLQHFVPKDSDHTEKHAVPRPWFEGQIKQGDSPDGPEN